MSIATRTKKRSKWGIGVAAPSYYDARFLTDLIQSGASTTGWIDVDLGGGTPALPATDAAGWPLAVAANRRVYTALGTFGTRHLEAGTYKIRFTGSLAGGGGLYLRVEDSFGGSLAFRNIFITSSEQEFTLVGPLGDDNWQIYMYGPITACPTNIKLWKVSDGDPATVTTRPIYKTFYGGSDSQAGHYQLRPMDLLGAMPMGVNNGGTYGGRWGTEWSIRIVNTAVAAGKYPYYLTTPGDNSNGGPTTVFPVPGEVVTGATSGATGVLLTYENVFQSWIHASEEIIHGDRPPGQTSYLIVQPTAGTFVAGEVLQFTDSGTKCVIDANVAASGSANKAVRLFDHAAATAPALFQERAGGLYEFIDMCNECGCGVYINLPMTCTAAYATGVATMVRDRLYSWLPVTFAGANEVWNNPTFPKTSRHYTSEAYRNSLDTPALDSLVDGALRGYGHHSSLVMDAVAAVFTGTTHLPRLTRAIEGWAANQAYNLLLLDRDLGTSDLVHEHHDALSVAPYVNNEGFGSETTHQQLHDNALSWMNGDLTVHMDINKTTATTRSLRLISYEGGQHFATNVEAQQALNNSFQLVPLMGAVLEAYFAKAKVWGLENFIWYVDFATWGANYNFGISQSPFNITDEKPATWLAELNTHPPIIASGQSIEDVTGESFTLRIPDTTLVRHVYCKLTSAADTTYVYVGAMAIGVATIACTDLAGATNYTLDIIRENEHGLSVPLSITQSTTGGSVPPTPPSIAAVPLAGTGGTTPVRIDKTHGTGDGTITSNVELSTDGETSWLEIQATSASLTYTHTTAPSGVTRYYRSKSTSAFGDSNYSTVVSALAVPPKFGAPTLFQVSPTANRGEIAPPAVAGSSYRVYRRAAGVGSFVNQGLTVLLDAGVLKWTDNGAAIATAYDYAMTVIDEDGQESEMGTSASITTMGGGAGGGGGAGTFGSAVSMNISGIARLLRGARGRR